MSEFLLLSYREVIADLSTQNAQLQETLTRCQTEASINVMKLREVEKELKQLKTDASLLQIRMNRTIKRS